MENKNISHYDENGVANGYFEHYGFNGNLTYRCNFKGGQPKGYDEYHILEETKYYIR